ncbi:MAG: leucine-rich repeat domain-containing protein [Saprospiraceae bacterium]|nr:leucine-rich repeat domain-containing protein [Saprospiraceae bacterium]
MHRLFPLFLSLMVIFGPLNSLLAFDRATDSLELVKLYKSTDGAMWSITWNLATPMNTWHGVTLDATGQVTSLSLPSNNLKGALPNLFLPKCVLLSLSRNTLRDTLPVLGGLPAVRTVDISNNEIDGQLFDFNLPKVEILDLSNNKIQGSIPDFSKMPLMKTLKLHNNRLDGTLPDFTNMRSMLNLWLFNNFLEGPIAEFNFMPDLLTLDLHSNRLGGITPAFRGSKLLFILDLSDNNLSGFVPNFSMLRQLETLRLNNNRITGPVANFSALTVLSELDISNNLLEGPLPTLTANTLLTDFNASGNNFGGKIPLFTGLAKLQRLDLGKNQLVDTLPNLSHLISLTELRVDSNLLVHSKFDVSTSTSLRVLEVQGNRFTFSDIFMINGLGLNRFIYGPQRPIQLPDSIFATIHQDVTIDLIEDFSVGNNTYEWWLNGESLVFTALNELRLNSINALDQGTYFAIVRNMTLDKLVLLSEEVYLLMDCPFNEVEIIDSICVGDTIFVNKKPYFETGNYRDTLLVLNPAVCDSIFIISLSVFPEYDTTLFDTICESDQVMFAGQVIEKSGFYTDTLSTINGCDSIVHLNLIVYPAFTKVDEAQICAGDTLLVGHLVRTATGIYKDTLQTIHGCDSVIITDLTVLDTFRSITEARLCFGETYEFRGVTYSQSGTYIDRLTNQIGCDSLYILDLVIPQSDRYPIARTICAGDSVIVGDTVYKTTGLHIDSLLTGSGCDSVVELTLSVTNKYEADYNFTICVGDTLFFGGDTLTRPGIFIDSLSAQGGCDSIIKVRLNVDPFISRSLDTVLCFGDSFKIANNIYKVDGIYRDTLFGERCDTVVISFIQVNSEITLDEVRTVVRPSGEGFIEPTITGGTGTLNYLWSTGARTPVLDSVMAGTYRLTVTDQESCSAIFDLELDPSTAVSDRFSESISVQLFPNPIRVSTEYTILFEGAEGGTFQIQIFDLNGKRLDSRRFKIAQDREIITLNAPAYTGMYT